MVATQLALALALAARPIEAARLLSSTETLRTKIGTTNYRFAQWTAKTLATIRAQVDDGAFADAWQQGQALTVDQAVMLALDPEPGVGSRDLPTNAELAGERRVTSV